MHYTLANGTPCSKGTLGAIKHDTGGAAAKGAYSGQSGRQQWRR